MGKRQHPHRFLMWSFCHIYNIEEANLKKNPDLRIFYKYFSLGDNAHPKSVIFLSYIFSMWSCPWHYCQSNCCLNLFCPSDEDKFWYPEGAPENKKWKFNEPHIGSHLFNFLTLPNSLLKCRCQSKSKDLFLSSTVFIVLERRWKQL